MASNHTNRSHRSCNNLLSPFVNFINYIVCFDIILITIAFLLSIGNILSKDPYMGRNYYIPYDCIIYFCLGFLLTYKCLKKIAQHCQIYRHFLIVCIIFLLMFTFFYLQLTYNDQNLNLPIRIILSAGSSIFFVSAYALHVYYENKTCIC
ncbi:hypothetical protein I4U23_008656 [Adineta vaga]|nr:hypothetical protein I4U23_008656 [Adineta vaga]